MARSLQTSQSGLRSVVIFASEAIHLDTTVGVKCTQDQLAELSDTVLGVTSVCMRH